MHFQCNVSICATNMSWTWLELKQKHPRIDAGVVAKVCASARTEAIGFVATLYEDMSQDFLFVSGLLRASWHEKNT